MASMTGLRGISLAAVALAQAGAGVLAAAMVASGAMASRLQPVGSTPDWLGPASAAATMALFGAATLGLREGRRRLVPSPSLPLAAGEKVVLMGCAVGAAAALWGIVTTTVAWGSIEDGEDESILWMFIGVAAATVGHLLLAVGFLRTRGLRVLALGSLAMVAGVALLVHDLEYEYEGPGEPPLRLPPIAWPLLWAVHHVLAGATLLRRGMRMRPRAVPG